MVIVLDGTPRTEQNKERATYPGVRTVGRSTGRDLQPAVIAAPSWWTRKLARLAHNRYCPPAKILGGADQLLRVIPAEFPAGIISGGQT